MYLFDLYTVSTNLAGIAAMSIPCGFSSAGLPIGLHLQSPPFEEERLLRGRRTCFSRRPTGTRSRRRWRRKNRRFDKPLAVSQASSSGKNSISTI